ncbi:hypothetical protein STEG23_009046, partial [Scotinomys teguina]
GYLGFDSDGPQLYYLGVEMGGIRKFGNEKPRIAALSAVEGSRNKQGLGEYVALVNPVHKLNSFIKCSSDKMSGGHASWEWLAEVTDVFVSHHLSLRNVYNVGSNSHELSLEVLPPLMFPMTVTPLGRDQDCSLKIREPEVPALLVPGSWRLEQDRRVSLYFIFPGICTLSLLWEFILPIALGYKPRAWLLVYLHEEREGVSFSWVVKNKSVITLPFKSCPGTYCSSDPPRIAIAVVMICDQQVEPMLRWLGLDQQVEEVLPQSSSVASTTATIFYKAAVTPCDPNAVSLQTVARV